jgi:hypothetical protein
MSNVGMKVSEPFRKVLTELDKNLVYSSDFYTFKKHKTGIATFTTNGSGAGSTRIPHSLKFPPTFRVFRLGTASWQHSLTGVDSNTYANAFFPDPGVSSSWVAAHSGITCSTDSENLLISGTGLSNNTIYTFKYFIFDNVTTFFNGDSYKKPISNGINISTQGVDVRNAKDYQLKFSSKYDYLQYRPESILQTNIVLPTMAASISDQEPEEATYVDIFHHLPYPPFFIATVGSTSGSVREQVPYSRADSFAGSNAIDIASCWCDETRIRISMFLRADYAGAIDSQGGSFNIRCMFFDEDLRLN